MAAPEGNHFWELRSSHGRDLIFSSPEILWDAAKEYFEATVGRPWIQKDWVGKDAVPVDRKTTPPFTVQGLCVFLEINPDTWYEYRKRKDFSDICTRIETIIYTQKFEGASVGAYNANIIARDLGLIDKTEELGKQTIKVTIKKNGSN